MIRKMGGLKKVQIARTEIEAEVEKSSVASLQGILGNCSFKSHTHIHKNLRASRGCLLSTVVCVCVAEHYILCKNIHSMGSVIHPLRVCVRVCVCACRWVCKRDSAFTLMK